MFWLIVGLLLACLCSATSNYDTSMVHRLLRDRHVLIQDGLSFFNGTKVEDVKNRADNHEVREIMAM